MITEDKKIQIRDFLIALAKKKNVTGYLKLNEKLKLGVNFSDESQMNEFYQALDEISFESYQKSHVFLGLVVINKMRNRPGPRFFAGVEKIIGSKIQDTDNFFEQERDKLYDQYASK
jgi:hypothetical protein